MATVERNPRIVHRRLGDGQGSVLLHLDSGAYHGVNDVGALTWELIEAPIGIEVLLSELRQRLENVPPELNVEIETFLRDLEQRDLVRFSADRAHP